MRKTSASSSSSPAPKTSTPCCSKVGLKRGPWTPEEDELLANYINREGEGRWRTLPKRAGLLRCGKSCRLRWMNYLRPSVKRGQIAPDEEDLILRLHRLLGNRWSLIAGRIPGRTDNEIKNYWNTHLSKKLISQGIDPRTHKPLHHPALINSTTTSNSNPPLLIPKPSTSNPNLHHHPPINHTISNNNFQLRQATHENHHHLILHNITDNHHPPNSSTDDDNDNKVVHLQGLQHQSFTGDLQLEHNDDHDDMMMMMKMTNYCGAAADDVFSTFLNSIINDEAFSAHQGDDDDDPLHLYSISAGHLGSTTTNCPELHHQQFVSTNSNFNMQINYAGVNHDHHHSNIIANRAHLME